MRADQIASLNEVAEKLIDVFLAEANPDAWPGAGLKPAEMSSEQRGDRVWCKKDAAGTLIVITKAVALVAMATAPTGAAGTEGGTSLEAEVKTAEREANQIIHRMQLGASAGK